MDTIRHVLMALALIPLSEVPAQEAARSQRPQPTKAAAYVFGRVTRTGMLNGGWLAEFAINQSDGLRAGDRLIVVRPTAANSIIDELLVKSVDHRQAVGRCAHGKLVAVGDVAVFQRTLSPDVAPTSSDRSYGDMYAEITFWNRPVGETRTTFNARIERITWEGMLDVRDIEALVLMDGIREARMSIPATSVKQMRLNGLVLVVDPPKQTLVAAAIHDYREVVRADVAERRRIELAKARIASEERIRIAEAQARIDADAQIRIAETRARVDADTRAKLAAVESNERIERARIEREYVVARQRIESQTNSNSNDLLSRALTAVGGLLQIGAYFMPERGDALNAVAGGTQLIQAMIQ